jgi:transcriptional regulator with GAF, ATPase, and Fis domain
VEEKAYTRRIGLQSNLTIPITVGEQPVCALATGTFRTPRGWPDSVVERVRMVGQVFANALHRQRIETELRGTITALERNQGELETRLEEIRQLKDRLEAETVYLRTEIRREKGFDAIVGRSPALLDVLAKVTQVAPTTSAVLLLGETVTGKELLAHAIHDRSPRRHGPS